MKMEIYEKVIWQCPKEGKKISDFLWKKNRKYTQKAFSLMENDFERGLQPLTHPLLEEFIPLYRDFISNKDNAHIRDIKTVYSKRIENPWELFFCFVREKHTKTLIGWGIMSKKIRLNGDICGTFWFMGFEESYTFDRVKLGMILDFLFYQWTLEDHEINLISKGQDRNGYGTLWTDIGLALYKIRSGFLPKKNKKINLITIDETTFKAPTLIFTAPDTENYFKKALLFKAKEYSSKDELKELCEKRGIEFISYE